MDLHRQARPEEPANEPMLAVVDANPELLVLKERYRGEFEAALRAGVAVLDARQRTIVELYYLEDTSAASIGTMYGVTPRTIQRWLVTIHEQLLDSVRAHLARELDLSEQALDSLIVLIQSDLDLSLHRLLDSQ